MDKRTYPVPFDDLPETPATPGATLHEREPIELTQQRAVSPPISTVMIKNLSTVHAEDSIHKVEEAMHREGLSSVPVMGSNGVIVGIIGAKELAEFVAENKNPRAVCAWEVSRCTDFEVAPETTIAQVSSLMTHDQVEYIAVTKNGILLGAVSALDILRANEAMLDMNYVAECLDGI